MCLLSLLSLLGEQKGPHLGQMWQTENVNSKKHYVFYWKKFPVHVAALKAGGNVAFVPLVG